MDARSFVRDVLYRVQCWRATEYPSIDLCKKILAFFGSWHTGSSSQNWFSKVFRYFLPRLAFYISVYGFFIGHPWLAYQSKGQDIHLTVESASATIVALLMCSVFGTLLFRRQQLERLFGALNVMKQCSLRLPERPSSILDRKRKTGEYPLYFLVCCLSGLLLSLIPLPLMFKKRMLIFDHWYPFDVNVSPAYEVVFVYTTLAHVVGMSTLAAFHTMLMSMFLEARDQFHLLSHNLSNINNVGQGKSGHGDVASNESTEACLVDSVGSDSTTTKRDLREEITVCVLLHYAVLSFVKEMDSTFKLYLCLSMVCTLVPSGMCILLLFYADSGDKNVQYSCLIIASNIGMLLCCWMGNQLTEQDEAVREAVYECDWIDQSESFKRSMRIIMSHSNQPVVIKVAGFVPLSMETYYAMTKLTYSYIMAMWSYFKESVAR